jgi:hypothetical protein
MASSTFTVTVNDEDIINACDGMGFKKPDSPTMLEIAELRESLPYTNRDMICGFWLRNRIVNLRKASKLGKQ